MSARPEIAVRESERIKPDEVVGYLPTVLAARSELQHGEVSWKRTLGKVSFSLIRWDGSLWMTITRKNLGGFACRLAFTHAAIETLDLSLSDDKRVVATVETPIGTMSVITDFDRSDQFGDQTVFAWKTDLTPAEPILSPAWPRDFFPIDADLNPLCTKGTAHCAQAASAAPLLYATLQEPAFGSALYLQNLADLDKLAAQVGAPIDGRVGGSWPALGFELPETSKPLEKEKRLFISSGLLTLSPVIPETDKEAARLFLDLFAELYLRIPQIETQWHNWPALAGQTLNDLKHSPDCTVMDGGHRYIRPYVAAEYPDSMCQLTVALALREYERWTGQTTGLADELLAGVPAFFDTRLGTIRRYLQSVGEDKEADEVDSWYLYHPLKNLGRLAEEGHQTGKELFLTSLDYAIKVARHFKYHWPVKFNVRNLATTQQKRKEDEPGQSDVGGLYAYIMSQAYSITANKMYLKEAKRAIQALDGLRFKLSYQLNITSAGVLGCMRLFKITRDQKYLDAVHSFLATFFHHSHLHESKLRHACEFPNFFGALCLHDGEYISIYEEFEAVCDFQELLAEEGGVLGDAVRLLVGEYIRHALHRLWYFYPMNLPDASLATEVRNGHIDRRLGIPLEDLSIRGEPLGAVGQEVYGAGAAFALTARFHHRLPNGSLLYCDMPITDWRETARGASFKITGHEASEAIVRIVEGSARLIGVRDGCAHGGSRVRVEWK